MAWLLENTHMVLAALLVIGVIYFLVIPQLLRRVFGRTLLVLAPLLLIAITVLGAIALNAPESGASVLPALVVGTIAATGWLVTFLAAEYRRETEADSLRRDTLLAVQSEIMSVISKLDGQDIDKNASRVEEMISNGVVGEDGSITPYFPFSTLESEPVVFSAVAGSIPTLDSQTVKRVLRFYAEYTDLRQLVEDSRSDLALSLPPHRRVSLHKQLTLRRKVTLRSGLQAYVRVSRDLGLKDAENVPRSGKNTEINP